MRQPDEFLIQDVRCFQGEQRVRLRPITLLVGENSTGKTTLLGCYSALDRLLATRLAEPFEFSYEPFSMGSFRDIVRSRRGREGRITEFRLGIGTQHTGNGLPPHDVVATFEERGSQPVVKSWRYQFQQHGFLEFRRTATDGTTVAIEGAEMDFESPLDHVAYRLDFASADRPLADRQPALHRILEYLNELRESPRELSLPLHTFLFPPVTPLIPVAPLRAKPHRTYDPIRESLSPEGTHVPMLMMRLHHSESQRWGALRNDLVAFGKNSGLFSDIKVKRHGRQISDPFQIQVKVHSGSHANIMDVGYGVSQSLPILVELLRPEVTESKAFRGKNASFRFLLQQPEVHLHPRGQAELASFLVNSVKKRGHQFLVETHSDHIIDRIRISVMKKMLKPEDVSILYFEPHRNFVTLHNIGLDEQGNILNAPPGYRDFFMRETEALLGLDG